MAGERIEVKGLRALSRDLRRIDAELPRRLRAAAKEAADDVAATAKTLVPVRSGALQRSIRPGATQRGANVKAGQVTVPYAGVIHFGSVRHLIRPQPFLYDALDARRDEVVERFASQVEALVESIHSGTGE